MAKVKPAMAMLDVFVLFLMRDGVRTLYALKKEAGISIGAASPSLRRLNENDMIAPRTNPRRKAVVGKRGKREYEIGLFAQKFLEPDWIAEWELDLPFDTESVARLVAMAEASNRRDVAKKALAHAITDRRRRAQRPVPPGGRSAIAARYRNIVKACETARLKAEAAALKKILAGLQ
jgi:hypothetical protein